MEGSRLGVEPEAEALSSSSILLSMKKIVRDIGATEGTIEDVIKGVLEA